MSHQPALHNVQNLIPGLYTVPVLMNDLGRPILFLATPDHLHAANEYPKDSFVDDPDQPEAIVHVNPGYQSKIEPNGLIDGSPSTGLTSFNFCINYSACNGMRQTDGKEICEAVERLVERMVADRTWRREFGCREDETSYTDQRNGPEATNEESQWHSENTGYPGVDAAG